MNNSIEPVLVSVLMTAFNREKYIAQAIESVLHSTYSKFELIIVDDCSNDLTVSIAKEYEEKDSRVRVYVNEVNIGDYPNRNKAANLAKGKYIKYLDSDDIMYPHCLGVMVNAMEKFNSAAYGLSSIAFSNNQFPRCISPKEIYLQHFNGFGHFDRSPGSSIIRRDVFEKEGGFIVPKYAGDTELWFRLGQKYDLVLFQRDLVWDRCHTETESNYEKKDKEIRILRKRIVSDMLNSPFCPLEDHHIQRFKQNKRSKKIFIFLKRVLKF